MEPQTPLTFTDTRTLEEVLDLLDRGVPLAEVERTAATASLDVRAVLAVVNALVIARGNTQPPMELLEAIIRTMPSAALRTHPLVRWRWVGFIGVPAIGVALVALLISLPTTRDGASPVVPENQGENGLPASVRSVPEEFLSQAPNSSDIPPVFDELIAQSLAETDTSHVALVDGEQASVAFVSSEAPALDAYGSITTYVPL